MDKTLAILGALTLALIAVTSGMILSSATVGGASLNTAPPLPDNSVPPAGPAGDALALAKQFVTDDPTFKFDGLADTLEAVLVANSDPAIVAVNFTSRHAGYGNRAGLVLAQVLTPHRCLVKISGGQVVSAVMDEKWDMIGQKAIPN